MNERLKILRKKLKLSQAEFGEIIYLTHNAIYQYEIGKIGIKDQSVALICDRFNVNENWLRFGEGEMRVPMTEAETIEAEVEQLRTKYELDERSCEVLRRYLRLTPEKKTIANPYINAILGIDEDSQYLIERRQTKKDRRGIA